MVQVVDRINDYKRLRVIDELYNIRDLNGLGFLAPSELNKFSISFGRADTRNGIGRVKVVAGAYLRDKMMTFTFYGRFNHIGNYGEFRSVQIDREFEASVLLIIDCSTYKINRPWHLGDVGVEVAVEESAGVCPEEADADSAIKLPYVQSI